MKISGNITETLVVSKSVEVEAPSELVKKAADGDPDAEEEIRSLIQSKAYEETIFSDSDSHGWEGEDTVEIEVEWTTQT